MLLLCIDIGLRLVKTSFANNYSGFVSKSSVIGMTIGVTALIVVSSALNGFEKQLLDKYLGMTGHIDIKSPSYKFYSWSALADKVSSVSSVVGVAPRLKMQALIKHDLEFKPLAVTGIDLELDSKVLDLKSYFSKQDWDSLKQPNNIVLGQGFAESIGAKVGDTVDLYFLLENSKDLVSKRYNISGLVNLFGNLHSKSAYVSRASASSVYGESDIANYIKVKVDKPFEVKKILHDIHRSHKFGYYASVWTKKDDYSDIQIVRIVIYLVFFTIILVSCLNIVCSLVVSVRNKRSAIAILRTFGFRRLGIMFVFLLKGLATGCLGIILGSFFGVLISLNLTNIVNLFERLLGVSFLNDNVYFINFVPSIIDIQDILIVVCSSIFICLFFSIYPAYKACKLEPSKVLAGKF